MHLVWDAGSGPDLPRILRSISNISDNFDMRSPVVSVRKKAVYEDDVFQKGCSLAVGTAMARDRAYAPESQLVIRVRCSFLEF